MVKNIILIGFDIYGKWWPPSSRSPIRVLVASLYSKQIANKLIQAWNESVQDCFMGVVHVAVEKIISPPNHCRLAAIYVSRFDGPMLMAFSGWSTDVFPHMFWKFLRLMRGCHEMSNAVLPRERSIDRIRYLVQLIFQLYIVFLLGYLKVI